MISLLSRLKAGSPTQRSVLPALASLVAMLTSGSALAQTAAPAAVPGFKPLWSRSVEPLRSIAISPQGQYTALITRSGKLALWDNAAGKPVWSIPGITAHNVAAGDTLGYVLTYDAMNRLDRSISLYRSSGGKGPASTKPIRVLRRVLDGAIWATAISLDGSHAACGTGSSQVYLIDLHLQPVITKHPVDGICNDLAFANNNEYVAVGLWNRSGAETMTLDGRIRWSYLTGSNRRDDIAISPDSSRVLAVAYDNPQSAAPSLSLLDDQGTVRWTFNLGPDTYLDYAGDDQTPTAVTGSMGQITYVSFKLLVRHGRQVLPERALIALGPLGNKLWSKGGLFFSPTLISATPDGSGVIAYDNNVTTLYRLNSQGQAGPHDPLPGSLIFCSATRDRTKLLIYTSDGQLSLLGVE